MFSFLFSFPPVAVTSHRQMQTVPRRRDHAFNYFPWKKKAYTRPGLSIPPTKRISRKLAVWLLLFSVSFSIPVPSVAFTTRLTIFKQTLGRARGREAEPRIQTIMAPLCTVPVFREAVNDPREKRRNISTRIRRFFQQKEGKKKARVTVEMNFHEI